MKVFKLILTLVICATVFYSVDFSSVLSLRHQLSYFHLGCFMSISAPMIWASSAKWKLFIPPSVTKPSVPVLMRYYTISYFANLFLPSSLGGDAARSLKLGSAISSQKKAFLATFFERYTGLITLVFVALIGGAIGNHSSIVLLQLNLVFLIFLIVLFYFFVSGSGLKTIRIFISFFPDNSIRRKLLVLLEGRPPEYLLNKEILFKSFLWSLLFYLLTVINTYLGLKSISVDEVSILDLMYVVPLVLFVSMLPITPGAIGVMEGAFVYFLTRIGVGGSEALALGLLLRIKALILALLGWFLYLREGSQETDLAVT